MTTPPRLFDTTQIARNLARRPPGGNFVRDLVLEDLADRLSTYKRDFTRAVLIGPEGGFDPAERDLLRAQGFVLPVTLGPRILRADTAAAAALSVFQAALGDWD